METPRRIRLDKMTPAEKAIYDAAQLVEQMGCDQKLTEAIIKLSEARNLVADVVDQEISSFEDSFSEAVAQTKK